MPPSFLSISVFSSAGLVLPISETASFISSLTLFDPFDPFVFCGLCLSLFLTFGIWDFSVMFFGIYSNFYFSKAEMRKRTEKGKEKKGETKWKQNCEVASKECAMLPHSPPSSPLLSLPSSLIPPPTFFFFASLVFIATGVYLCACARAL